MRPLTATTDVRNAARAALLALAFCAGAGPAAAADSDWLQPFKAVYSVKHGGIRVGETTLQLHAANEAGVHKFSSVTKAKGIAVLLRGGNAVVEETSFVVGEDAQLRAIEYEFDDGTRKGADDNRLRFDWQAAVVRSEYRGSESELSLTDDTVDRLLEQLAWMRDASTGNVPDTYRIVDRDRIKLYEMTALGREEVGVPAGTFMAEKYHHRRPGSSREWFIWMVPELGHMPVKLQQMRKGERKLGMELRSVERVNDHS